MFSVSSIDLFIFLWSGSRYLWYRRLDRTNLDRAARGLLYNARTISYFMGSPLPFANGKVFLIFLKLCDMFDEVLGLCLKYLFGRHFVLKQRHFVSVNAIIFKKQNISLKSYIFAFTFTYNRIKAFRYIFFSAWS